MQRATSAAFTASIYRALRLWGSRLERLGMSCALWFTPGPWLLMGLNWMIEDLRVKRAGHDAMGSTHSTCPVSISADGMLLSCQTWID